MFARALIVLLLVLNVGVGLWWVVRTPPAAPSLPPTPPGVARLQLVAEAPAAMTGSSARSAAVGAALTTAPQCFSFGPFNTDQLAVAAQARLQPQPRVARIVLREQRRGSARGWRVLLPPSPSAEQAAATAQRIAAAGFDDYFVVRDGSEAHSIALGRYGNEAAARRRAAALVAAGFDARAEALGGTSTWLDVSAAPGFDPAAAQRLAAAPERRDLDCTALQGPPAPAR